MSNLLQQAPDFSVSDAAALVQAHYGFSGHLSPLDSERDQNFKLVTEEGARYTLKFVNAQETAIETDFQTALLDHLARTAPDLPVPRLVRARSGAASVSVGNAAGQAHAMRLVRYVPGEPFAAAPRVAGLLGHLGATLGQLDRALQSFIHPGALRSFDWDIRQAGASRQRLGQIEDAGDRALLTRLIDRFDHEVAPHLAGLRAGVIHNDANDYNVLVDPHAPGQISGIIDFGDALHAPIIAEVAVAAAYAMLDQADPLGAAAELVAGFHGAFPLEEGEVDLLFDLITMRLVMSVTLAAARSKETAANPYLAISAVPAWAMLRRLGAINPRFATAILRKACGFDAAPGAGALKAWLVARQNSFASLFERHPARLAKALVPYADAQNPMTVASREFHPDAAQDWWLAECARQNVALGIGPFGEERSVYAGPMFDSRLIAGARRTRHLGLDFFLPAGTPVFTPLAGTVRSVDIETEPLGYGCLVALEHHPDDAPPFVSLWGHLAHEAKSRLVIGERLAAGALVGEMGGTRENGGWAPHLHLQLSTDIEVPALDILGVGEARYIDVWADLFPDAAAFAGLPPETFDAPGQSKAEIVAARRRVLLPNLSISYQEPAKFVRGDGVWLIDHRGRAYLDCFNNVCHLGHCHPDVVEALARQAARLNTNTRYLHDTIIAYAERLTATLPKGLEVASFVCTGSEANALMLRMVRAHTGRKDAIVLDWAYHGTTPELIDLSPYKYKRKGGEGRKDHIWEAAVPDCYHAPADWPHEEHAQRFARSVADQIAVMAKAGRAPGLFIAESIPSVAGQVFLPDGYLAEVYALVRAAGGLCVADEVQVGFGRVGSHFWAFETQDVVPDIVTMGKPIGNGHPMAAVVTTRAVASSFNNGMEYFNTFGGNPVSCAVGLAVLDVIERDALQANAAAIGAYLMARFKDMQARYACIGDVRGMGLFLGIELVTDRASKTPATDLARKIANLAYENGVLMGTEGPHDNVLKLRPPMIFTRANADYLIEVLDEAFRQALR